MASVWGELKRRNVVKVAVAYAIVSWLVLQQPAGDTVRINVRLINAAAGEQLWANPCSGRLDPAVIFASRVELAEKMIAANPLSVGGREHLVNVLANADRWDEAISKSLENQRQDFRLIAMNRLWKYQLRANRVEEAAATFKNWAVATNQGRERIHE